MRPQEAIRMPTDSSDLNRSEDISSSIYAFSRKAYDLAKQFVAGTDPDALKAQAETLKIELPSVAAKMKEADEERRPGLNRVLSEARLDLDYVIGGGGRPSSMRLGRILQERS